MGCLLDEFKIFEDGEIKIDLLVKKFVSGRGEITAGFIIRITRLQESLQELALDIYNTKLTEDKIFSNRDQPLKFVGAPQQAPHSILLKVDYSSFDDSEMHLMDCYING